MVVPVLTVGVALMTAASAAASGSDALVSTGSPDAPFSQNKQNEPTVTADANSPTGLIELEPHQSREGSGSTREPHR